MPPLFLWKSLPLLAFSQAPRGEFESAVGQEGQQLEIQVGHEAGRESTSLSIAAYDLHRETL